MPPFVCPFTLVCICLCSPHNTNNVDTLRKVWDVCRHLPWESWLQQQHFWRCKFVFFVFIGTTFWVDIGTGIGTGGDWQQLPRVPAHVAPPCGGRERRPQPKSEQQAKHKCTRPFGRHVWQKHHRGHKSKSPPEHEVWVQFGFKGPFAHEKGDYSTTEGVFGLRSTASAVSELFLLLFRRQDQCQCQSLSQCYIQRWR